MQLSPVRRSHVSAQRAGLAAAAQHRTAAVGCNPMLAAGDAVPSLAPPAWFPGPATAQPPCFRVEVLLMREVNRPAAAAPVRGCAQAAPRERSL